MTAAAHTQADTHTSDSHTSDTHTSGAPTPTHTPAGTGAGGSSVSAPVDFRARAKQEMQEIGFDVSKHILSGSDLVARMSQQAKEKEEDEK